MESHSHLFMTEHFQKFFSKLKEIAPDHLSWSEAGGKLICKQQPVASSEDKQALNTVENVMKKLKLTIKPGEHKVINHESGVKVHVFTLKGIYNQINNKKWVMNHLDEVVKLAKKGNAHSGNQMHK